MSPICIKYVQLDNAQRHYVLLALDQDYIQLSESELSLPGNKYITCLKYRTILISDKKGVRK